MSDDEADPSLLALLREFLGLNPPSHPLPPDTRVLSSAEHIYNHSIDVALDMAATKAAATTLHTLMSASSHAPSSWSAHPLHPTARTAETVDFIFTLDLLNFSFWSPLPPSSRFQIAYNSQLQTGYWSLVALLQRALAESIPITTPSFWADSARCTDAVLAHVFRSATPDPIPLFAERVAILREAGAVLCTHYAGSTTALVEAASHSAARLVNLLVDTFPSFEDSSRFAGKEVRFLKRAQIFVADLWACFEGQEWGRFDDIDCITMFADYRIPQVLRHLDILRYSPALEAHIQAKKDIVPHGEWEVQIRGCSVWAVELLRREMVRRWPGDGEGEEAKREGERGVGTKGIGKKVVAKKAGEGVNAILIDFFLYDLVKRKETEGEEGLGEHHRTRSIRY